jgi:hypothetical protein
VDRARAGFSEDSSGGHGSFSSRKLNHPTFEETVPPAGNAYESREQSLEVEPEKSSVRLEARDGRGRLSTGKVQDK